MRFVVIALLLLSSASLSAQGASAVVNSPIRPGDLLRVTVWRKPELSGDFLVAADSTLKHPLYREVKVAGLTPAGARERLVTYLRVLETAPQVSVEALVRVSVGGAVQNPNLFALSPETTIAQAIAQAGGATERGQINAVQLLRDGRVTVLDITQPSGLALLSPVASGDQIIVPRKSAIFREVFLPLLQVTGSVAAVLSLFLNR